MEYKIALTPDPNDEEYIQFSNYMRELENRTMEYIRRKYQHRYLEIKCPYLRRGREIKWSHYASEPLNKDIQSAILLYSDVHKLKEIYEQRTVTELETNRALHLASSRGYLEIIQFLISQGADVNWRFEKYTPLIRAIMSNELETVIYLIENGANVDRVGVHHDTPLIHAIKANNLPIMACLLEAGCQTNKLSYHDNCAFGFNSEYYVACCEYERRCEMIKKWTLMKKKPKYAFSNYDVFIILTIILEREENNLNADVLIHIGKFLFM